MNISPSDAVQTGKWSGTPIKGSWFTRQQLDRLAAKGIPALSVSVRMVKIKKPRERNAAEAMAGIPSSECFDSVEVACPVIHRGRGNEVVLTPGGDEHWLRRR